MILALILFLSTYVLLLLLPKYRAYIALTSALLFIVLGILPLGNVFGALNWNVLMMLAGTMGIVSLFIESKMPSLIADHIIDKVSNVKWAVISLALFAGIVSAFIDNVATVLMIAPIALNICKKLKISPVPSILAIAISSNLQGAATLVGDTTSILLGGHVGMDFFDFFVFEGKIGLFFIVEVGALAATLFLIWVFRKENQLIENIETKTVVKDYFPSILLSLTVILLIVASFVPNKPDITNGFIVMVLFLIGILTKLKKSKSLQDVIVNIKEIDFFTLLLISGLFIVIAGIEHAGVITVISNLISEISNGNIFLVFTIIVWISVLLSAFIDNIPYVATMLPVVGGIAASLGLDTPYLLYFGLIVGATLGGNLTPIGASANITAIGILRREGHEVTAKQFMKLGIPFTLIAVTVGYILVWFIYR